ncbi:MAG: hypothetical protein CUN54_08395 [Phototrophicales bacterium]|nr:MAG: hypothetical protein CUN54_08395 [Phototrophicales bacterium]
MTDNQEQALPAHIGEYGDGGIIKTMPTICAASGQPLIAERTTIRITGTRYFYCVNSAAKHLLTPEKRDEIEQVYHARRQSGRQQPVAPPSLAPDKKGEEKE